MINPPKRVIEAYDEVGSVRRHSDVLQTVQRSNATPPVEVIKSSMGNQTKESVYQKIKKVHSSTYSDPRQRDTQPTPLDPMLNGVSQDDLIRDSTAWIETTLKKHEEPENQTILVQF